MEKLEPKITCKNCNQQIYISWSLNEIRCSSCKCINQIQRSEDSYKDLKNKISCEKVVSIRGTNDDQGNGSSRGKIYAKIINKISGNGSPNSSSYLLNNVKPTMSIVYDGRPKKRAVLCGVSYMNWKYRLKGTVSDAKNMKELLIKNFDFPSEGIRVLTEEEADPKCNPTKKNIQEALQWLVKNCESGDSLVFFFSGHGLRQPEFEGDEIDGYDETICPVDFKQEGMILDNDINSAIVRPLTSGVTLHAFVDACHSGTILDLPYVYNYSEKKWDDNRPPAGTFKGTSGGKALSFSACGDNQMAADTNAFSGKAMSGAMTYSLIRAIKQNHKLTYAQLLTSMHDAIKEANAVKGCLHSGIFSRMFHTKLFQEPMLSASETFDINITQFKL